MTKKDIVARLRECDQGLLEECQEPELGDIVTDCSSIAEAANVIERLRAERDRLRRERDETRRARDEARRGWCRGLALETYHAAKLIGGKCALTAEDIALERGWYCFKEENHNA